MVGYSGVGRGFGVEVRLGSQISVVWWRFLGTFSGFMGMRWCVHGFLAWFVATRSVCSWVCVNFDLIFFFVGHLVDSEFAIGLI